MSVSIDFDFRQGCQLDNAVLRARYNTGSVERKVGAIAICVSTGSGSDRIKMYR